MKLKKDKWLLVETEEEFIRAINLIWTMKCEGWWHYKKYYFENDICTPYEYWVNLGRDRTVKLYHFVDREDIRNGKVKVNNNLITEVDTILNRGDIINVNDKEVIVK